MFLLNLMFQKIQRLLPQLKFLKNQMIQKFHQSQKFQKNLKFH
jgi:hypothetical protein